MTAFQACADVRSSAFFKEKTVSPTDTDKGKATDPTVCDNPELAFPDCLPPLPVCDDPATIDKALLGAGTTDKPFVLCRPAHLSVNRRYGN